MESAKPGADHEFRLNTVLLEYVEAIERGEKPDRDRMLDSYPEFAEQLKVFFKTRDRLALITAPLRTSAGSRWAHPSSSSGTGRTPALAPNAALTGVTVGRVGDFRLIREVGRGGMGIVYEAEQISLRRRVALKVLPFVAAIDPRHLQRFRNESHAAAQLHHSNIVPVYAVGAEGGVHYYAMQFIDGQSLAELLAELREAAVRATGAVSSERATPLAGAVSAERAAHRRRYFQRIAGLVRQAAEALDYAHQVGVVHRDVKPANLMLDDTGRLWVTDFGLAQMRNDGGLTATGEVLGTARYMSPEQAAGQRGVADHRTDIYSLGATLYELLTLAPVFDAEDGRALLYLVACRDPKPPRVIDSSVPVELETVVLKALAKAPSDRYASAREFADDLGRFLDDRPVLARRPTLLDRATKWVRRHRAAAASAVGALLLLAIGFAVSTAIIAREHSATKHAYERELQANDRERQRAEEALANYLRTKRAVDLFVELSDEELLEFPPLAALRQRLLEAAVAYYQELTESRVDPAVQADLAASRARLAKLQDELTALTDINTTMLLDQANVRAELGLSSDQAERLVPLLDKLKAHQRNPVPDAKANRRGQLAQLAAECRRDVEGVLTAAQYRRLKQVLLQIPGPHVFSTNVLTALGLTDTQRAEVRRILSEATQSSLRIVGASESRAEGRVRFDAVWRDAVAKIIVLFAQDQRERWNELTGPPVVGEVRFPGPERQK